MLYNAPWYGELLNCRACSARDEARRPVPGVGPIAAEILCIGQNPGEDEDIDGQPFIGRSGAELDSWLKELGLNRAKLLLTNIVHCHTTRNRVPTTKEIATCSELWLTKELQLCTQVQVLIPLGRPALEAVVGRGRTDFGALTPWWTTVEFETRTLHVLPLAHPAYLLRVPQQRGIMMKTVLPAVKRRLEEAVPEVYARAAL